MDENFLEFFAGRWRIQTIQQLKIDLRRNRTEQLGLQIFICRENGEE